MVGRSGVRRRLKILFPALLILCSANFILFHRSTGCVDFVNFSIPLSGWSEFVSR